MLAGSRYIDIRANPCSGSCNGQVRQKLVYGQPTSLKYLASGRKLPLAFLPMRLLKPCDPSQNGGHGQAAFDNMREDIVVQNCQWCQPEATLGSSAQKDRLAAPRFRFEWHRHDLARASMAGSASRYIIPCAARAAAMRHDGGWLSMVGIVRICTLGAGRGCGIGGAGNRRLYRPQARPIGVDRV